MTHHSQPAKRNPSPPSPTKQTFSRFALLLLLAVSSLLLSQPAAATSQGWLNNSATFSITPKWSLKFTQELRALDITYADPYMHNLAVGIVYHLPKNVTLAALYKREHVDIMGEVLNLEDDIVFDEDRLTLQGTWKAGLANDLSFDVRAKIEFRSFNLEDSNHTRFRLRLKLTYDTHLGTLRFRPFVATETFGKTKIHTVQKNRFYLGSIFPLGQHVELIVNYIWLNARDLGDFHIINTGFDLKF
ncbi:MAG: DUF2490 domain-containing protein [Candidatus Aminicenantaceae bacterium]